MTRPPAPSIEDPLKRAEEMDWLHNEILYRREEWRTIGRKIGMLERLYALHHAQYSAPAAPPPPLFTAGAEQEDAEPEARVPGHRPIVSESTEEQHAHD